MVWTLVIALAVALNAANAEEVIPGIGHNPKAIGGPETELATKYYYYNVTSQVRKGENDPPGTQLGYHFWIPLMERLAGITYQGNAARLRLFLERARKGEQLRVSALGGSITAGQGVGGPDHVYLKNFMDWLNTAMPPRQKHRSLAAAELGLGDDRRQLSASSNSDKLQHEYLNGGVPGIQSSYVSSCLKNHLIPDPDLVFIDFAVNDSPLSTWTLDGAASRRPIERLYRKVLGLPSKPAVVLVNIFALGPSGGKYHHSAERDFMELASYYGIPAISLRAAVLPSAYVNGAKEVYLGDLFNGGWNHPGRGGHAVLVEMLVTMCLDLLRSNPSPDRSPKDDGCDGTNTATMEMIESVAERELPPPLLEGNYESDADTCYFDEELPSLVVPPVVGWNWTDEGRGKWGFVTSTKGQTLRLKVNTKLGGKRTTLAATQPILLQLAYLQSYAGMGVAQVSCVDGCVCDPVTVDAYDPRPVSVTNIKGLKVTQHSKCVLAVTSMDRKGALRIKAPASGEEGAGPGTKFKLMGVVVGEEPGSTEATVSFMRGSTSEIMHRAKDLGR